MAIFTIEDLRRQRRIDGIERTVPFRVAGEMHSTKFKAGRDGAEVIELTRPMGELVVNATGRRELAEKITLDFELGREEVPLVYAPIYQRLEDSNFPRVFDAPWAQYGVVVFMEWIEGQEVNFGSLRAEEGPIARILTYAAGFEYTREMVDFNQTFEVSMLNQAMGEAYNALLNHIHLAPILNGTYAAENDNLTELAGTDEPDHVRVKMTLEAALDEAAAEGREATVLLTHPRNRRRIERALQAMTVDGTQYPATAGIEDFVYYAGWSVQVGRKSHSYPGVGEDDVYLIRPNRGFKELVKQDLIVEIGDGDLSRLVEEQIVGYAHRGVFAAVEENVQKVDLSDNG